MTDLWLGVLLGVGVMTPTAVGIWVWGYGRGGDNGGAVDVGGSDGAVEGDAAGAGRVPGV